MRYHIVHQTRCQYDSPVMVCHYMARLTPRALPFQACPWHEIDIKPNPNESATRSDGFGNTILYFEIEGAHEELEVVSRSLMEIEKSPPPPTKTPTWETIRAACHSDTSTKDSLAGEYIWASPLVPKNESLAKYAAPSFPPGRSILDGVIDLNARIFKEFTFDPVATNIATPIWEVLETKRGVCQDFAQVMIGCLRSIGLPARYVSGYLETLPPPGKPKLVGADASHAWLSVWCGPECGWIDVDPTNNLIPSHRHITLAWGRDFSDVSPLRGVTLGAGNQRLTVSVDVKPVEDEAPGETPSITIKA